MAESDERYTPEFLLKPVREFCGGPISLDVCTAESNPTGAISYWDGPGYYDGLRDSWAGAMLEATPCKIDVAWCNPPYSRGQVIRWAAKAIREALDGCEILMLTRADVRTAWFRLLRENCDQVCLINHSVGFVLADGTQLPGDSVGHALWHFGGHRSRFRGVFEPFGWVVDGPGVQEAEGVANAAE